MKHLKNYQIFLEEKREYQYGCVLIELNLEDWNSILDTISKEDLYLPDNEVYGMETNPHLTLLYGLHKEVSVEDIEKAINQFNIKDFKIEVDGIDIFENEQFDVLKMKVFNSKILNQMHLKLKELPNSDKYEQYSPHITIAYLKSGTGNKYIDENYKKTINDIGEIVYSKDGVKTKLN